MNWQLLSPLLVTIIVAIVGWFIVHRLTAARDRENKRREQCIQYLVDAFRSLAAVGNRPELSAVANELELALADIQLFGTADQIKKAQYFAQQMGEQNKGSLDDLMTDLRQDLRKELHLSEIRGKMWWLRFKR